MGCFVQNHMPREWEIKSIKMIWPIVPVKILMVLCFEKYHVIYFTSEKKF